MQSVLKYGEAPADVKTVHAPEPLETPGCYVFRVFARRDGRLELGNLGVTVSATGTASQMSRNHLEALFTRKRV